MTAATKNVFEGKKVLITGGLGFIGSALAHELVNRQADVTVIDSLVPEYGGNPFNVEDIKSRIHVSISDIRDQHALEHLVLDKDLMFNLAGQTSHLDSMNDPRTDLEINAAAQLSILEACRRFNPSLRIVFASTRQIYGKPEYLPVDEKHPIRPVDVNGINKTAGEWYHLLYSNVYGIPATVLRLTNTYGPRMRVKDARQTFLGLWFMKLLKGEPIEVWGGKQLRDFTYVDDCVRAFLLASDSRAVGKVYNLGGDCTISLSNLAKLMIDVLGKGEWVSKKFPADRKKIDIGDYYSDYSFIAKELGWKPSVPLREGIAKTFAYYRDTLARYL